VLAFIGLERTLKAAVTVFDITDPSQVQYVDMIVGEGDRSPESLVAFKAGSHYCVAVAHEVSDTTSLSSCRAGCAARSATGQTRTDAVRPGNRGCADRRSDRCRRHDDGWQEAGRADRRDRNRAGRESGLAPFLPVDY
jgi:hypothetical protein